jgi:serine/threonine protein kinase
MVGQTLRSTYRILSVLEQGGMGTVYRGEHLRLRRPVAIKVLAQHLVDEPAALMRFRSEAEIISQLHHPHVVHVLDFDTTEHGDPYIVMELLTGETLSRRLSREHVLGIREIVQVVTQTAGGLLVAHAAGVVHRDLKPDNVFLLEMQDASVFVKLLDFGISKRTASHARMTGEFEVLGTPDYMAPEQILNTAQTDHRADQWSLAAITYEMLSGRIPFYSDNVGRTLAKVLNEDPPALSSAVPGVSQAIAEVVRRGLAKAPVDRFPSIVEYAEALARAAGFSSTPSLLAWSEEQTTHVRKSYTPPLGEMRPSDALRPSAPPSSSDAPGWAISSLLDSESRLPIPTVPRPPPDSSELWPHSPAHTVRLRQSTPPAQTSAHPVPLLAPRQNTSHPSSRPPGLGANSRLRRSESPSQFLDVPRESLRAPRVPNLDPRQLSNRPPVSARNTAATEPAPASSQAPLPAMAQAALNSDSQAGVMLAKLHVALDDIRQAVTFGEEQRALSKARQAVQLTRAARQPDLKDLLSSASELLRPILLRSLGGHQRKVTVIAGATVDSSTMSPEHLFLLSRVDGTATIEELLDTSPLGAPETLAILLDFRDQGCLGFE